MKRKASASKNNIFLLVGGKEIGQTLEKNTFGKCKIQPNGSGDYFPCQAVITKWSGFYEKVTLSNKGKILLEDRTEDNYLINLVYKNKTSFDNKIKQIR